jgi:peptide-methionine (R)-S-oxide reductase
MSSCASPDGAAPAWAAPDTVCTDYAPRAGTSLLDKEYGAGTYRCAGCDLRLLPSDTKFDSGTGWPRFWQPLEGAVGTSSDRTSFMVRTEAHCQRCGGDLGHVFEDGPQPTGLRYRMNGASLSLVRE